MAYAERRPQGARDARRGTEDREAVETASRERRSKYALRPRLTLSSPRNPRRASAHTPRGVRDRKVARADSKFAEALKGRTGRGVAFSMERGCASIPASL